MNKIVCPKKHLITIFINTKGDVRQNDVSFSYVFI